MHHSWDTRRWATFKLESNDEFCGTVLDCKEELFGYLQGRKFTIGAATNRMEIKKNVYRQESTDDVLLVEYKRPETRMLWNKSHYIKGLGSIGLSCMVYCHFIMS